MLSPKDCKKGEIYQIKFDKNYQPEMSYEHRGLVIGVKKNTFTCFQYIQRYWKISDSKIFSGIHVQLHTNATTTDCIKKLYIIL